MRSRCALPPNKRCNNPMAFTARQVCRAVLCVLHKTALCKTDSPYKLFSSTGIMIDNANTWMYSFPVNNRLRN